jgi:hypothetical protein
MIFRYGLEDVKIASWTTENSYGTAIDFGAAQMFEVTFQAESATLDGDNARLDSHSILKGLSVKIRGGEVSLDVLGLITGVSPSSLSGTKRLKFDKVQRPYFALCGKTTGTGDGGDTHVFGAKLKLTGDFSYKLEMGAYVIPEVTFEGVYEGTVNGFGWAVEHTTAVDIAIPPA